jgi:hypothetical protein
MKISLKIILFLILVGSTLVGFSQNEDDVAFEEIDTILNKVILK